MKIFIQNRVAVASTKEISRYKKCWSTQVFVLVNILTWRNLDWSLLYQLDHCQTNPSFLHLIDFYTFHKCSYVTTFILSVCKLLQVCDDDYLEVQSLLIFFFVTNLLIWLFSGGHSRDWLRQLLLIISF